jgi:glycosyltransferase involved in cell wall biosynthesis
MANPRVMILIPALNAALTLDPVVRAAREHVADVVVVNDGSRDATGSVAEHAGAKVLIHEINRGKGGALKTGFAYAVEHGYEAVITLDADGQHLPSDIPRFLERFAEGSPHLIIGSRRHLFEGMSPRRRMANSFSSWAIATGAGVKIDDSQSGFRLYSRAVLEQIPLRTDGFDMESEVLVRAGVRRLRVVSIPIGLGFVDGLSTSHFRPVRDVVQILWTAVRARFIWR